MIPAILFAFLIFLLPLFCLLKRRSGPKRLPPGSLAMPIIGQTLSYLSALQKNTAEEWFQDRARKYGPVSKMHLFGTPTVFLHGQAANKFFYTCDGDTLSCQQPSSVRRICGEKNILELSGLEHKRVRGALLSILKPEALKRSIGKMDELVREHFHMHWHGKKKVSALPLTKTLTFDLMCSIIAGIEQGAQREILRKLFYHLMEGLFQLPINLPFIRFNRSIQASEKIRLILMELIQERRVALEHQNTSPHQDIITTMLSLHYENDSVALSDEEIVDNVIFIMMAGHVTSSVFITLLIRILAKDPSVLAGVIQEQEKIAESKAPEQLLTWDDLAKMKYTWTVATESLRMWTPAIASFRRVLKDFEYEGYVIPKGWQVMSAACMTHMDECIFPNASEFDPKHFDRQSSIPPYSFMAFGAGPRICPGNEFARVETLITIHFLVNKFTWKLCRPDISIYRNPMPNFKDGLEIEIEPKIPGRAQ